MKKKTKALALFLTMAMIVACLTGCMGVVSSVEINADESGSITVRAGYTKEGLEMMQSFGQDEDSMTLTDQDGNDLKLEELEEFTYNGVKYYGKVETEEFTNFEELNELVSSSVENNMEDAVSMGAAAGELKFEKTSDGAIVMTMDVKANEDTTDETTDDSYMEMDGMPSKEEMEELMKSFVAVMEYKFPSAVTASETVEGITIDGNKVTVDFVALGDSVKEDKTIKFTTGKLADLPALPVAKDSFTDVASDKWYYTAIEAMAERGLVNGVGGGLFKPEDKITYAQFCNIAAKSEGLDFGTDNGYWAAKAIKSCVEKGYIENRGEINAKNYDVQMPREAAVAAMSRIFSSRLEAETQFLPITGQDIPDYTSISATYQNDIVNAYNAGITNGVDSSKTFSPKSVLTRAQVCQLFYNVYTQIEA